MFKKKLKLKYVKCLKTNNSRNFIVGKYYPIIDYNNGITMLGEKTRNTYFQSEILFSYFDNTISNEENTLEFEM